MHLRPDHDIIWQMGLPVEGVVAVGNSAGQIRTGVHGAVSAKCLTHSMQIGRLYTGACKPAEFRMMGHFPTHGITVTARG